MQEDKQERGFYKNSSAGQGKDTTDQSGLLSVMEEINVRNKLKYQSMFEHIDTGFAYLNAEFDEDYNAVDFVILECNTAFKNISGITGRNIIGEKFSCLFDLEEEWCRKIFSNLKKVCKTKEPVHFEVYRKKHHKYISFSFYCPIEGHIELISRDITELKDTNEMKRINMYFSSKFISTPPEKIDDEINNALFELGQFFDVECCCIFLYDGENDTYDCRHKWISDSSDILRKYYPVHFDAFTWLREKMHHNQIVKLINLNEFPEEAAKEKEFYEYLGCKSMIFLPISNEDQIFGILQIITCNYKKVWSVHQVDLLKVISNIFASAICKKSMDETIRKEIDKLIGLKEVLKDSEELYRKLTFSIQDAIIVLNDGGRVVNWNEAAERIFGYTFQEVVNRKLHQLVVPVEMIQKAEDSFIKFKDTGKGRYIDKVTETHAVRKDGSRITIEISISVIKLKGITHTVGIIRDITERRQTQKKLLDAMDAAQAANKAKSQFLANISHEIRTPMNGIIGFMDLLSKTPLNSQQKDCVREIKTATDALMDLINDLLDFSKIEANKLELENIEFSPRKLVEEATSVFSLRAYAKNLTINAMIDNAVPYMVMGDPGKLKQVIENLISNALKFTHKGQVTISVKLVLQTAENAELLFSVSDTGIGISELDQQKLFEPFTQVDASTTRKYGGTGLGLSISERLVEMMSGKISVESLVNQGSTFSFRISFDRVQGEAAKSDDSLKGLRILIADPNSINREIVRNYLEGAGCIVSEVNNAKDTIEKLKNVTSEDEKIQMVLLDDMPEGKGIDIAEKIKAEDGLGDRIINLFTPFADPCDKNTARSKGITELIAKPVYREALLSKLLLSIGKPAGVLSDHSEFQDMDVIFSEFQKKKVRILLAEDNVTNQKLAAAIMNNAGLAYDISNNGSEAVKATESRQYNLILMDCQMPEMDGYEATRLIRQKEAGKCHTVIIAMTANVLKSDIDRCLASGMDDYIGKPFKADYFLKTIAKWLNRDTVKTKETEASPEQKTESDASLQEMIEDIPGILDALSIDQHIDRADIYEIYNEYVDLLPQALEKLQIAVDASDFKEISGQAHTLKGSSATLRLKYMSGIASEIDKQAKAGDIALCRSNMGKLSQYCRSNIRHFKG